MRPEIFTDPRALLAHNESARKQGWRIALVPTMGFLHRGHVSLLEEGRRRGDLLVLSIFVNPTQFGPAEDLGRYPHDLEGDLAKAARAGVDVAFIPDAAAMYPAGYQTYVDVRQVARGLCGDRRPGHFIGVATVVLKLFHLVQPHVAIFGEKDYQQLAVIRRMVRDLHLPVQIVGLPTLREPDGLAMSSRNSYLSPEERRQAVCLHRGLGEARRLFENGERRSETLVAAVRREIEYEPAARIDYVEARDAESLAPVEKAEGPVVVAVAAFVGHTRLIDNLVLGRSETAAKQQ